MLLTAIGLVLIQAACLAWYMPFSQLTSTLPLLTIDHAYHWYQIEIASQLWRDHALIGFDPTFAGGYLGGVPFNASAKLPALIAVALEDHVPREVTYKFYVAISATIAPALVALAAKKAGGSAPHIAIAGLLGFLLWWASGFHWYHTAGMVSFVLASFLALPWAIAASTTIIGDQTSWRALLTVGVVGGMGFLLHPHFPILAGAMMLPVIARHLTGPNLPKLLLHSSILIVCAIIINWPWMIAIYQAPASVLAAAPYQKAVDLAMIPKSALGLWSGEVLGAKINPILLLFAAASLWRQPSRDVRSIAYCGLATWFLLVLLGSAGAALPFISSLQPNRWIVAAYVPLVLPAAYGLLHIWRTIRTSRNISLRTGFAATVTFLALLVPLVETIREIMPGEHGRYGKPPPEIRPLGDQTQWLLQWIRSATTPDARILFETSLGRKHDGAHIAGFLARTTQREFIGGPYPFMFQASAWDGHAFGYALSDLTTIDFERRLHDYNIGWVVAHSDSMKKYLSGLLSVQLVSHHTGLSAYRVIRVPTYFLEGSGHFSERTINRLHLTTQPNSRNLLSYHYVHGLRAHPEGNPIYPIYHVGFDLPFIGLTATTGDSIRISHKSP